MSAYTLAPLATDFYKTGHKDQYPEGITKVYSNFTCRSDKHAKVLPDFDHKTVFFGLQGLIGSYLIDFWNQNFFAVDKTTVVKVYKNLMDKALGPDAVGTSHIEALHDLGYLPIRIRALKEGSRVNIGVPLFTIENTHPNFAWLVNYLETPISAEIWKPITTATTAYEYRRLLEKYAKITGSPMEFVDWQGHDFSMRGLSGIHDSTALVGPAHLTCFTGTDTPAAIDFIWDYYTADDGCKGGGEAFIGGSVPASEHSVSSSNIMFIVRELEKSGEWNGLTTEFLETDLNLREQAEKAFLIHYITNIYPTGICSYVSDTYDFFAVLSKIVPSIKDIILNRKPDALGNAKTVFRPDCYSSDTMILTPEGWKYFKDLTATDLVAQVLDDGSHEFVKPIEIINQRYIGDMYHFYDQKGKVDLLVTPNHRMVVQYRNDKTNSWVTRIEEAEKLKCGHHYKKMFRTARAKDFGRNLSDKERLKIAFQADGSYCTDSHKKIRFSFAKQRKIDRVKSICDALNLEYSVYALKDQRYEIHIKTDSTEFSKDFSWVNTSDLCSSWCEEFLDELKHWDSSIRNSGRFKFDTTNESVANVVERIAIAAGKGVLISKAVDNRKEHFSDVFTAHIMEDNRIGGQAWEKSKTYYDGTVHCVKVPSGKVLIKRNRSTLVSGNSGDPVKIICGEAPYLSQFNSVYELYDAGYRFYRESSCGTEEDTFFSVTEVIGSHGRNMSVKVVQPTPEMYGAVEILWRTFGGTFTDTGHRLLDSHVGLIYGDSITLDRAQQILKGLDAKGFASGNIVFGIGSYTYQMVSRDTFGCAIKATAVEVNGELIEVYKDPKTDDGTKKSARGLLRVEKEGNNFVLYDRQNVLESECGELRTVFEGGTLLVHEDIGAIRNRIRNS